MRVVAVVLLGAALMTPALAQNPEPAPPASMEDLFRQFGLFGVWAMNCAREAARDNPHVRVVMSSPGLIFEEHDVGSDVPANRYSVLSAERMSSTRLGVNVIFQPGGANEERQSIVFDVRDGQRRTWFNQATGGKVRVRNGVVQGLGVGTPTLHKCGEGDQP